MSSRPAIKPYVVVASADMSTTIISKATILTNLSMVSYQVSWNGTAPVGQIILEGSDNYAENLDGTVKTIGTWVALPLSATASVTGDSDTGIIDVTATSVHTVRVRYVPTSGTGLLNVLVSAKVA